MWKAMKQLGIEWWIIFVALIFGLTLVFTVPPFQVMDEYKHFFKAYAITEGQLFCSENDQGKPGMYVPSEVRYAGEIMGVTDLPYRYDEKITEEELARGSNITPREEGQEFVEHPFCESPVWATFPQAFGIAIGKVFHVPLAALFYLGRITNLLCSLFLLFFAIRFIPWGKVLLGFVILLPMFMHQLASYSLDAFHYSSLLLFVAYILYLARKKEEYSWKQLLNLALLGVVSIYAKIGFMPFVLLFFLLPEKNFKKKTHYWGYVLGNIVLCGALFFLLRLIFTVPADYVNAGTIDRDAQLMWILSHPVSFVDVLLRSVQVHFDFYWKDLLGVLGWMDYPLLNIHYFLLCSIGVLLTFAKKNVDDLPSRKERLMLLLVAGLNTLLLFVLLYAMDDPVGAPVISFMQGKYMLPLLPLGLLGLTGIRLSESIRRWLLITLGMISIPLTLFVLSYRYYDSFTENVVPYVEPVKVQEASAANPIRQTFVAQHNGLRGVAVYVDKLDGVLEGPVKTNLRDGQCGEIVQESYIREGQVRAPGYYVIDFDKIDDSLGKAYCVEIFSLLPNVRRSLPIVTTLNDVYPQGKATKGGATLLGDVVFKAVYSNEK